MALLVFSQTFLSSVWLTIANLIFSDELRDSLRANVPGVNPEVIISAGGTGYEQVVPEELLGGVTRAYSDGVAGVFYLLIALGCLGFLLSFGIGWKDIRNHKKTEEKTTV